MKDRAASFSFLAKKKARQLEAKQAAAGTKGAKCGGNVW